MDLTLKEKQELYKILWATSRRLGEKRFDADQELLRVAKNPEWYEEGALEQARQQAFKATADEASMLKELSELEKDSELLAAMGGPAHDLILSRYSKIEARATTWLWFPYIPIGRLTLLEGDPGQGKTYFSLSVATSVTLGAWWYTGEGESLREPANVLHVQCEDDPEDTVKHRLNALQADQDRIFLLSGRRSNKLGHFTPITLDDIPRLTQAVQETKAKLIIIDPLQAYLPKGMNPNAASEVRPLMMQLQGLAKSQNCAVLLVRHLSKANADRALYRGSGSIDWTAAARSVLRAAKRIDPETDRPQYLIAQIKNNITAHGTSLIYEINQGRYEWVGTSEVTGDQLDAPANAPQQKNAMPLDDEVKFVMQFIHTAERSWTAIVTEGRKYRFTPDRLERALQRAKAVKREVDGMTYYAAAYKH